MGAWVTYGLGSENQDLPAFVVLISQAQRDQRRPAALLAAVGQRLPAVELPGRAVPLRRRPGALPRRTRRASTRDAPATMLDALGEAEPACSSRRTAIRRSHTRIAQYEMAYRMQTSVPELTDLSKEPEHDLRAVRPGRRASPARSPPTACWPGGWPSAACGSSSSITAAGTSTATCRATSRCSAKDTDQPSAALITDLKQRGLLDDTLVIWGGEFGRTVYCQGKLTDDQLRPRPPPAVLHHLAGRRRHQAGLVLGETDDFSYNIVTDPVPRPRPARHDPALLGIDHTQLTYRFQGRDFRLTDVHGEVVKKLLA